MTLLLPSKFFLTPGRYAAKRMAELVLLGGVVVWLG
jgi:hypothetical protein